MKTEAVEGIENICILGVQEGVKGPYHEVQSLNGSEWNHQWDDSGNSLQRKSQTDEMKCPGYTDLVSEYKEQEISFQKTKMLLFCCSICLT